MSHSRKAISLSAERRAHSARSTLATVMCLPLVDGVFPALVLAGALSDPAGIATVGLLVFGGSATVAVILSELGGSRRRRVATVLAVGAVVVPVAALEAAAAPTIRSLLRLSVLEPFAALVVLAVAARTASASVSELLPRPAVVVAVGLLVSLDPSGASLVLSTDPALVLRAAGAAGLGVVAALLVAVAAPRLRTVADVGRFRFGSAVALGVLALSMVGLVPSDSPLALAVLGVTVLLSFDPGDPDDTDGEPGDGAPRAVADGGAE